MNEPTVSNSAAMYELSKQARKQSFVELSKQNHCDGQLRCKKYSNNHVMCHASYYQADCAPRKQHESAEQALMLFSYNTLADASRGPLHNTMLTFLLEPLAKPHVLDL